MYSHILGIAQLKCENWALNTMLFNVDIAHFLNIAPLKGTVPKLTFNYDAKFVLTIMHFLHHTENVC